MKLLAKVAARRHPLAEALARTTLHDIHVSLGAKMVAFAGFAMPVQYRGIIAEHQAVRTGAGLFDVGHMGQIEIEGPQAVDLISRVACVDAASMALGQARYSLLLNEAGGTIDDIIVYRRGERRFTVVVNAANRDVDWQQFVAAKDSFDVGARNASDEYGLVALQGPKAAGILQELTDLDLTRVGNYHGVDAVVDGVTAFVARTGYTGEDGFELLAGADSAPRLWSSLAAAGGVVPCGLGARDTLRLEASMPLYGHELDEHTSPLEAGLSRFVAEGDRYVGAAAVARMREVGIPRQLVMLQLEGPGAVPRQGCAISDAEERPLGTVTSGSFAPWLGKPIAMGYVPRQTRQPGTRLQIEIRGKLLPAVIVKRPFYQRSRG